MKKFQDKTTKKYGLKTEKIINFPAVFDQVVPRSNGYLAKKDGLINYISDTCAIIHAHSIRILNPRRALVQSQGRSNYTIYCLETGIEISPYQFANANLLPHNRLEFWMVDNESPYDNIVGLMCLETGDILKEPFALAICPNIEYEYNQISGYYLMPLKGEEYYCDLQGNPIK